MNKPVTDKPIVLLGAGGHAAVLFEIIRHQRLNIAGIVAPEINAEFSDYRHYVNDDDILSFNVDDIYLINAIGCLPGEGLRAALYQRFSSMGYSFPKIISPYAIVSDTAVVEAGAQIMAGAIVQAGARIKENTIINTGSIIEHHCSIGANNHIAPGVTLSGGVTTGEGVYIGVGASVIQAVTIADKAIIGAGAIITHEVDQQQKMLGHRATLSVKQDK